MIAGGQRLNAAPRSSIGIQLGLDRVNDAQSKLRKSPEELAARRAHVNVEQQADPAFPRVLGGGFDGVVRSRVFERGLAPGKRQQESIKRASLSNIIYFAQVTIVQKIGIIPFPEEYPLVSQWQASSVFTKYNIGCLFVQTQREGFRSKAPESY